MSSYELTAETRNVFGKKVKSLRQNGITPCEIYGNGVTNQSIQVPSKVLSKTIAEAGNTNLIAINVDGKKSVMALARNIQYTPIKNEVLHVDFYAVNMKETVTVSIPVHILGESPLVSQGGSLVQGLSSIDIEALPADLPESINVDISKLVEFNDTISVSDLDLPDTLTIHSSLDSLLATMNPPRLVAEEEESDELASVVAEPEVLTARDEE